jgi:ADP-dependent NAD(P)H-hydrate dehydratase / NAD(P)H-hydrate epimerase
MKVVTAEEMREIDRKTIDKFGVPGTVLMERAGLSVAARIKHLYGKKKVIVVAGSGNNGGDGMVAAKNLYNEGWDVRVFLTSGAEDLKGDALLQYKTAVRSGVPVKPAEELIRRQSRYFRPHTLIIDAILGTGIRNPVTGKLLKVIRAINASQIPVISVDVPSGVSSDNGQVMGDAVKADCTVTFGLPKRGHFLYPGAALSGELFIEDIGFPAELVNSEKLNIQLAEKDTLTQLLPKRRKYSYKGDYGHILIVAGSRGKTGAAIMAAEACLRSGAGLVTIGVPESLAGIFQSRVTEAMILALPDKGDGTLLRNASDGILDFLHQTADIIAIGPGLGVSRDTEKIMKAVLVNSGSPVVVDADGLNAIKGNKEIFKRVKSPVILTPHPGEMVRLMSRSQKVGSESAIKHREATELSMRKAIEGDRINTALSFARGTGTYLVLKGVPTVSASPDGSAFINSTGNPGMATAGTGDVLTGMIAGLLGQGITPIDACALGVYLHGLAGDMAAAEKGDYSLIASDVIHAIPSAFKTLLS